MIDDRRKLVRQLLWLLLSRTIIDWSESKSKISSPLNRSQKRWMSWPGWVNRRVVGWSLSRHASLCLMPCVTLTSLSRNSVTEELKNSTEAKEVVLSWKLAQVNNLYPCKIEIFRRAKVYSTTLTRRWSQEHKSRQRTSTTTRPYYYRRSDLLFCNQDADTAYIGLPPVTKYKIKSITVAFLLYFHPSGLLDRLNRFSNLK